tara:strand:- start:4138 stop:4320 length:183 start_codon:yes stop_codon:yes gene_type:complete
MKDEIKSLIMNYISELSESIREIEEQAKRSGLNFLLDSRYSYLVGKRDSAKYILDKINKS